MKLVGGGVALLMSSFLIYKYFKKWVIYDMLLISRLYSNC